MSAAAAEKMPLSAHLREARTRAVRAAVALLFGTVIGYLTSDFVMDVLRAPITELAESRSASLNFDSVTGAFDLQLRIAVYSGIIFASPVCLGEIFGFLTPGLTAKEKKVTFGFLGAALPLFAAGCLTGLYVFPRMVEVLTSFARPQLHRLALCAVDREGLASEHRGHRGLRRTDHPGRRRALHVRRRGPDGAALPRRARHREYPRPSPRPRPVERRSALG